MLLTALAGATEHIGLIATASTTYNEPYNLARRFASLDHISGGRAGWNIVTTAGADAARNFSLDELPAHRDRYERAAEFVEVSHEAVGQLGRRRRRRRQGGRRLGRRRQGAPDRTTRAGSSGSTDRSTCRGRRRAIRCWCRPGSSEDGKEFAARYAEAVFTAQQTLDEAQAFYADLKQRAAALGRDPDGIKILPGHRAGHRRHRSGGARARGRAGAADHARVRPAGSSPQRFKLDPSSSRPRRASCPTTCRTRTRSRARRAATR